MTALGPVPDRAPDALYAAVQLARCLTAVSAESADRQLAFSEAVEEARAEGREVDDVWLPAPPGWVMFSEGAGRYVRDLPEGAVAAPPLVPAVHDPVSRAFRRAVDAIEEPVLEDVELAPWVALVRAAAMAPTTEVTEAWRQHVIGLGRGQTERHQVLAADDLVALAVEQHLRCRVEGQHAAPAVAIARLCGEASPAVSHGVTGMVSTGQLAADLIELERRVVDYVVGRDGFDPVLTVVTDLTQEGDEWRERALEASSTEAFGVFLHRSQITYLAGAGVGLSALRGAYGDRTDTPVRRAQTVAEERSVQVSAALLHWVQDLGGEQFRLFRERALEVLASEGERAAERLVDGWVERRWLFPRRLRSSLLAPEG